MKNLIFSSNTDANILLHTVAKLSLATGIHGTDNVLIVSSMLGTVIFDMRDKEKIKVRVGELEWEVDPALAHLLLEMVKVGQDVHS